MSNSEPESVVEGRDEEEEVFSSSDPTFWDYVRLKDFTKKTGIEAKDCHAFCGKEMFDNSCDIVEKWRLSNATITIDIHNDLDLDNEEEGITTISVSNPNPENKPVFGNLYQIFNYKRSFSSKSNQYKITRGAQGDALKELGTIPYMLINSGDGGEDKPWNHPLVFQHNKKIDMVYIDVDRKNRIIKPRFEHCTCKDNDTRVTITLPALSPKAYESFLDFCRIYTLFNTHLSFIILADGKIHNNLSALLSMSENYNNPNSIYCYSEVEFQDFLTDLYDKNVEVYNSLTRSEFREINQPGRFEDLKDITIAQLTTTKINEIHKRLRKSMLPMSELTTPYKHSKTKRKEALVNRYRLMAPPSLELDFDKAIYQRTDAKETIYSNKTIRFPFSFEVLAIPIKKQTQEEPIIISGVNYSTSINNQSYFRAGSYSTGYNWIHQNGVSLSALDIEEIIRVSSAGADINYDDNIASKKQRQPCLMIAHLVSPRPEYRHGYGKSALRLDPYSTQIAETIEDVVKHIPLRNRTKQSPLYKGPTGCLDDLLRERWDEVRRNPSILDRFSADYDPWTQSTVWYHLREEYLLPIERKYHVTLIKKGTREWITGMISERCEKLEGSPKREQLGIFASPRATMYVKGQWYRVDIDDIPTLAEKGTDVIFIEKQGVVEIIKHLEVYGIAFVNTQGHFADYPRDLVSQITENGGNVVILTDFDCAGIHIAERIIADNTEGKVKRLGIDMSTLDYFMEKITCDSLEGIRVMVRNENGDLVEEVIRTREQLLEHVEESYPKVEGKEDKQQPGTNVVNAIIRYAKRYSQTIDERYEYIYENFEYLTGLDISTVDEVDALEDEFSKEDKQKIDEALRDRNPDRARRIELDSIIKVVRANLFSQFILDKLQEFFPERDYTRAITIPKEYFADNFDILPERIKQLFLYYARAADRAVRPTDDVITEELENWGTNEDENEEDNEGRPILLKIPDEDALNEMMRSKAVAENSVMQELDRKAGELYDSLPPIEEDPDEDQ